MVSSPFSSLIKKGFKGLRGKRGRTNKIRIFTVLCLGNFTPETSAIAMSSYYRTGVFSDLANQGVGVFSCRPNCSSPVDVHKTEILDQH